MNEQSALRAGDGGFQVEVDGDTRLAGGAITSSEAAVEKNRNQFTGAGRLHIEDRENSSRHFGESYDIGMGSGESDTGMGFGRVEDSNTSTTAAGISGIAGKKSLRTSDPETGLVWDFDAKAELEDLDAQTRITRTFMQQTAQTMAKFADNKAQEHLQLAQTAQQSGDSKTAKHHQQQAKQWQEGGAYRVGLHTAAGAVVGGVQGAAGAAASSGMAKQLNKLEVKITKTLNDAGLDFPVAKGISKVASTVTNAVVSSVVSSVASSGSGIGTAAGVNVDASNRQLHPSEVQIIQELAQGDSEQELRYTAAACALVKCYAQHPEGSPQYEKLKQLADIGSRPEFASERQALLNHQNQDSDLFSYSDQGLFSDQNLDRLQAFNEEYQIVNRATGALQYGLGAAEVASGAALTMGGNPLLGTTVATMGLDNAQTGSRQLVSGLPEDTLLNQSLQSLGLSPAAADLLEMGTGLGVGAKASFSLLI